MEICDWGVHIGGHELYSASQIIWCKLPMIFVVVSSQDGTLFSVHTLRQNYTTSIASH